MKGIVGPAPREIERPILLLGEGAEEELFFGAFLRHLAIPGVQIESYGGKSKLRAYLAALRLRPGFHLLKKLLITRDADNSYEAAAVSVQSAITDAQLGSPRVSTFVLPGENKGGALEDLCFSSLSDSPLVTCIENYLKCANVAGFSAHLQPAHAAKARIHAWLAAQEPPDLRLGHASSKLNFDSPAFAPLGGFLSGFLR
jgi:hypothetical protein